METRAALFSLNEGWGLFGKSGLRIGSYKIEALYYENKMKVVNKHYNDNLYSVQPFDYGSWNDRVAFKYLIVELSKTLKWMLLTARRPFTTDLHPLNDKINSLLLKENILYRDKELFLFELNLAISLDLFDEKRFDIVSDIWQMYDQSSIILIKDKELYTQYNHELLQMSWEKIASNDTAYVIFKGVEEDVLWIGKSNLLPMPDLTNIW